MYSGERSGGGWGGGRGADIVRVALQKPLGLNLASRSFWQLYCCYRLSIDALAAPRPVALSLRVEQLLHVEQRLPRDGASPVRHLRPADLKALCGMWAG